MSHNYLLDVFQFIEIRLASARGAAVESGGDQAAKKIVEGRIQALLEFQTFLQDTFVCKLPRRIARRFLNN